MTSAPERPQGPAPASLMARFVGVIFSPRETLRGVAAAPRWCGMLLLLVVFLSAATFVFLSTEVGRQALLDQQVTSMESFGFPVTDDAYARMESRLGLSAYIGAAVQLVWWPLMYLIIAGVLFAVFSAGFGGDATFKQLYAVIVHTGAVFPVVQQSFTLPLNYARGSMSSPTNLAAFFPMLPDRGFATYALGAVDVFLIWWIVVLAIGLGALYRRRTQPIAFSLFVVYGIFALVIATVRSTLGGS